MGKSIAIARDAQGGELILELKRRLEAAMDHSEEIRLMMAIYSIERESAEAESA